MPVFNLVFFARTENVEWVEVPNDHIWLMAIKCASCNENFPKEVGISRTNEVEMDKQHGVANFSAKCKNCERKGYITILPNSSYKAMVNEDNMIKESVASFECRGLEIMNVILEDQFSVKIKDSPTVCHKADFTDLWAEYDEVISGLATIEQQKFDLVRSK
jgi:hypothetical protein